MGQNMQAVMFSAFFLKSIFYPGANASFYKAQIFGP